MLRAVENTVHLDAIPLTTWLRAQQGPEKTILLPDTIDCSMYKYMVGVVISEPNTKDDYTKENLKLGATALFSIYGVAPLDGQAIPHAGRYVCHLDFVLAVLDESVQS